MYRVRAVTVDTDGHENRWPGSFMLYPEEVEPYSREIAATFDLFEGSAGSPDQLPNDFVIESDEGDVVFAIA